MPELRRDASATLFVLPKSGCGILPQFPNASKNSADTSQIDNKSQRGSVTKGMVSVWLKTSTTFRAQLTLLSLGWTVAFVGSQEAMASDDFLQGLLTEHCIRCHGEEKAKGGLNLSQLVTEQPLIKNRERWNHVIDLVQAGEMPPEDETQPTAEQRAQLLHHLDQSLNHFDFSTLDNPGFESARRLTNQEYNRTVSDLLGLSLTPADRFPSDLTGASGFENSANTLFLQTARMERYIAAAERVVESAIPKPVPGKKSPPSFRRVITHLPTATVNAASAANKTLQRFLLRAYRRPPTQDELQQTLSLFHSNFPTDGNTQEFVEAIRLCIQATLVSPKFLLRIEEGSDSQDSFRINDYELASRLSYFLWATMPDDELLELASQDTLHQPEVLDRQVNRMLKHPYADALGSTFAAQWLGFQFMGNRVRLDPIDNPWCTDTLMNAMREESGLFFTSLVREDRPIDELVTANYTFLNEELANEIYGRTDIKGATMRRVTLENPNRGGILTHGSLMAITSNYKETSPIKRGNWILETVLGRPLPPPPPNAGAFKEEVEENDSLTFRQKVELHSSDPSCRTCHSKIDPLGFSLENFDYFGRWRESYRVRIVERNDTEALAITLAMRALSQDELYQRIDDLDSGPDTRKEIRNRLNQLRSLSEEALHEEITETLTASRQNRLIRLLGWLDIEPEDPEAEAHFETLTTGVESLRAMHPDAIETKLVSLELEEEEHKELAGTIYDIRSIPEERLTEILADLDDDDHEGIFEILELMSLVPEEDEPQGEFLDLVRALRSLDEGDVKERIWELEAPEEEKLEILEGANFLRSIPDDELEGFIEHELDDEFEEEAVAILLELELLEEAEDEPKRRRRSRFEQKPITGQANLPDGTPFQGPKGLKKVILSHHKSDLARQLTSKMLAYALGRQLEYYDEQAIRSVLSQLETDQFQMQSLIKGIVSSYPFQYKKNPSPTMEQ